MMSAPPHAAVRGVLDWVAISSEDGSTQVVLGSEQRPEVANASLTFIAGEVRDIGHILATVSGAPENGLQSLDEAVTAAYERFLPDESYAGTG
jgi:hypothetical protein